MLHKPCSHYTNDMQSPVPQVDRIDYWLNACGVGNGYQTAFWDCLVKEQMVLTDEFTHGLSLGVLRTPARHVNNIKN